MAQVAGILAIASSAVGLASAAHQYQVSRSNKEREEKIADLRGQERREELRKVIAAQRVGLVAQGRDPNRGTSLTLQKAAYDAAKREGDLDRFQTEAVLDSYDNEQTSILLNAVGSQTDLWSKYYSDRRRGRIE